MTHETVRPMTDPQKSDIIATMVGAMPPLTFDEAQYGIIGAKGSFVADIRAAFERAKQRLVPAYPTTGDVFELTLDGDARENDPIEMVRRDGYLELEKWRHTGTKVAGTQTRHFKLISVGYCVNWDEVKRKLAKHGELPEGQWREAFKAKYPTPDGNGPIGVPDASWVYPGDRAYFPYFPYVHAHGESRFFWSVDGSRGRWRWLVEVRK